MVRSCLLATLALCVAPMTTFAQDEQPNIVLVFMDNFGWGELGTYGGGILRGAPTPRIDRLADEGMRLLNFNVEAQCTPSRAAIMTGRYAIRTGNAEVPLGVGEYGLTQWEYTLAEMLYEACCSCSLNSRTRSSGASSRIARRISTISCSQRARSWEGALSPRS